MYNSYENSHVGRCWKREVMGAKYKKLSSPRFRQEKLQVHESSCVKLIWSKVDIVQLYINLLLRSEWNISAKESPVFHRDLYLEWDSKNRDTGAELDTIYAELLL